MLITIDTGTMIHTWNGSYRTMFAIESTVKRIDRLRNRVYFRYLGKEAWAALNDPGVHIGPVSA